MRLLRRASRKGGFGYVTGRRRVGKTALLARACRSMGGLFHHAVEGTPQQQIWHLVEEWRPGIPELRDVTPRNWTEFFALLSRARLPKLMALDEFPYLVDSDPSLPSVLQKWIDHSLSRRRTLFLVAGSSQSMLHAQFLRHSSPLFGRSSLHLQLAPLGYSWFCRALRLKRETPESFTRFSLVGGVPHYWTLLEKGDPAFQAEKLYFSPSAILAEEPSLMLLDERVSGSLPRAILDLVGRGVTRPNELASRLGTAQGNLSRPVALLIDLGFLRRDLPFGESPRTTKKVHYSLRDPVLAFHYGVHLAHRHRWGVLSAKERRLLIEEHASRQWEWYCRERFPGAGRYWEGDVELDVVAPLPGKRHLVAECKWRRLDKTEEKRLLEDLRARFNRTKLARKFSNVRFRIFSKSDLKALSNKR